MKKSPLVLSFLLGSLVTTVYAFNPAHLKQFEDTNKCSYCDLSGATLSKNHSRAELVGANLSGVEFQEGNFALANLENANLTGADLYEANFSHANLTGTHFNGAYMYFVNLANAIGANLSQARVCGATLPDGAEGQCNLPLTV